jgi:hypothetical protein
MFGFGRHRENAEDTVEAILWIEACAVGIAYAGV